LPFAAAQLITNRTERGELVDAYAEAAALVKRRPESASAHLALAYVLRYVGLLEESASECNTALALDPSDNSLRSCAWAFIYLGQPHKAMEFIQLDRGSEWASRTMPFIFLTQGKLPEARDRVDKMASGPTFGRDLLQACLDPERRSPLPAISQKFEATVMAERDPERRYANGTLLAYCGEKESALLVLKSAVEENFVLTRPFILIRCWRSFGQFLSSVPCCLPQKSASRIFLPSAGKAAKFTLKKINSEKWSRTQFRCTQEAIDGSPIR